MKLLDKLLGRLKPCGCRKPDYDGPSHVVSEAKFDSEMIDHGNVHARHDYVIMHCNCSECGGTYELKYDYDGLNSPHPDWREWTKTEMVEHENKMGEVHTKRKRTRHPDYKQCFNWSPWPFIKRMWRDGRGGEPDAKYYSQWNGTVQTELNLNTETLVEDEEDENE